MLNEISALLSITLIYLISLPVGYSIFIWSKNDALNQTPKFIRLFLYTTLGLLTITIISYILGFIIINKFVLLAIVVFFILQIIREKKFKHDFVNIRKLLSLDNIVPFILFILTFTYFIKVISIFKWPPPGDISNHGLFTSILLHNQQVSFTLTPYAPSVPIIPMLTGLHVLSANLSMLTGILPGESVFIVGGAIVILIPLLLYSLTYILTHSKILSLLTFLSTFLIGLDLETWVFGYFYNGPYPNLFGFLSILFFLTYHIATSEIQTVANASWRDKAVMLLTVLSILLVYPAFVVFPVVYLFVLQLYNGNILRTLQKVGWKNTFFILLFSSITALVIALFVITRQGPFVEILKGLSYYASKIHGTSRYAIYAPMLYTSIIGVAILVAGFVSVFFLVKGLHTKLALFYLVVFIPSMLSLNPALFPIFQFILPMRSIMICSLVSWVLILLLLTRIDTKQYFVKLVYEHSCIAKIDLRKLVSFLIIFMMFSPSLYSNLTFEPAHRYSWLMRHGFANDYEVLFWVHENVQHDELIMNDYSYTSRYLLSFSLKNVTAKYHFDSEYEQNRAIEVQDFWRNPDDIIRFMQLVEEYNISYILVTSERGYHYWRGIGGDNIYRGKPFTPDQYMAIYNNNPSLKLMFGTGNTGIFKVLTIGEIVQQHALEFDGMDDYIRVEHDESLMPSTEVSISFWIKPSGLPTSDTFLLSKRHGNDGYEVAWRWNNRFSLYLNGAIAASSNKTFSIVDLDRWWHITAVYDGSNAYIYINGELEDSKKYTVPIAPNSKPLGIGCRRPDTPFAFAPPRLLDELRIYNHALSPSEIKQIYRDEKVLQDLVLFLHFDEGEGSTAHDQSNYGNHGIIYEARWIIYHSIRIDKRIYR